MNNTYGHLVENIKQLARDAKLRPTSNKSKKARSILRKIIPASKIPWKNISHHQILSKLAHAFQYKSWNEYILFLKNYEHKLEQEYPLLADNPLRDDNVSYNLSFNILKNNIHFKNWLEYLKFYKSNYPSDRIVASNIKIFGANLNPWNFLEKNISF